MFLRPRNDVHLARRLWHVSGVLFIATLYMVLPSKVAGLVAIVAWVLVLSIDIGRLQSDRLNTWAIKHFGRFMRDSERKKIAGVSYLLTGATLIILVFPRHVVELTLLFLAFADPAASYFGIRFGRDKLIGEKSFQGSLAAFVFCFVLALVYFLTRQMMLDRLFIVCLLAGWIGALAELLPVGGLDDNFVFPIVSASLLTGLLHLFGGL